MRTNARGKHRVPAPEGLFPEWLGPSESTILDHAVVATPHVVHKDVDRVSFAHDSHKRVSNLDIVSMVAADAGNLLIDTPVIWRRTARDEDPRALFSQFAPDASANAFRGSRHESDLTI